MDEGGTPIIPTSSIYLSIYLSIYIYMERYIYLLSYFRSAKAVIVKALLNVSLTKTFYAGELG